MRQKRFALWVAALRGLLGAFLGAFLGALVWFQLMIWGADWSFGGKLTLLGGFWVGPAACLGYRLYRGLRERRFAWFATHACALLALFPALPAILVLEILPACGGSLTEALDWVKGSYEAAEWGGLWIIGGLLALLGTNLCQKRFLRYTDAAWAGDPRRAAAEYAGGLLYNYRPEHLPPVPSPLPEKFSVGAALEVDGEIICVSPALRRGRSFSVTEAAGVILGPGSGSNVLYDFQGRVLAKFAWSMENAALFAAYLAEWGVPLISPEEYVPPSGGGPRPSAVPRKAAPSPEADAPEEGPPAEGSREESGGGTRLRQDYQLQLRPTAPALAIALFCGGMVLSFVLWTLSLLLVPSRLLRETWWVEYAVMGLFLAPIVIPAVWALASGQIFPPRLSAQGENVYLYTFLGGVRQLRWKDLGGLYAWDSAYILFDKKGKTILKFSDRDACGPLFMKDLLAHGVRIRERPRKKKTRERN